MYMWIVPTKLFVDKSDLLGIIFFVMSAVRVLIIRHVFQVLDKGQGGLVV